MLNFVNNDIIVNMRGRIILLFICFICLSCKTLPEEAAGEFIPVPEILIQGNNFKTGLPSIVKTQKDLQTLYSLLYGDSLKAPVIDFSKKTVVTAAAGPFNTGGYSVVPISAIKTGKIVNLVFEVKCPGPKDMVTQAFTHPYTVVSVDAGQDTEIFIEIRGNPKKEYDMDF